MFRNDCVYEHVKTKSKSFGLGSSFISFRFKWIAYFALFQNRIGSLRLFSVLYISMQYTENGIKIFRRVAFPIHAHNHIYSVYIAQCKKKKQKENSFSTLRIHWSHLKFSWRSSSSSCSSVSFSGCVGSSLTLWLTLLLFAIPLLSHVLPLRYRSYWSFIHIDAIRTKVHPYRYTAKIQRFITSICYCCRNAPHEYNSYIELCITNTRAP